MIGLELSPGQTHGGLRGDPQPLSAFFGSGGGQRVALAKGVDGGISVWTEVAPSYAACLRLDNDDPATRLSWRETLITELRNIYPVGAMTLTGSWSKLQSSGSGLSGSYTGNRAVSTSSLTAMAEVTVDRAATYDLWIHYTGRISGGYVKIEIDGAQTLVNEIDDPAGLGFKAFSSYTATDLQRRQSILVASGLTESHTVQISSGGTATPGGNAILIEAVAISGSLADPYVLPPLWQPNTTYEMGDEVCFGGTYYSARGNGDSGTVGPIHTSGIASDGVLDWRADKRPTYPRFVKIDYPSEREYAVRFSVDSAPTEVGGQTHGNEALVNRSLLLDGTPWVPSSVGAGLSVGSQIAIVEDTIWQKQAGGDVADCRLTRGITAGSIRHDVQVTGTGPDAVVEWFYAGMLPMVRWNGESGTTVIDTVSAAGGSVATLSDHSGMNPTNVTFNDAHHLGLSGQVDGVTLTYGHEVDVLPVVGNVIGQFDAFLRPNLDAMTESGSLDWIAKAYIEASAEGGITLGNGDVLAFYNRHVLAIR